MTYIKYLFIKYILGRRHAQYDMCPNHRKTIIYSGECSKCWGSK